MEANSVFLHSIRRIFGLGKKIVLSFLLLSLFLLENERRLSYCSFSPFSSFFRRWKLQAVRWPSEGRQNRWNCSSKAGHHVGYRKTGFRRTSLLYIVLHLRRALFPSGNSLFPSTRSSSAVPFFREIKSPGENSLLLLLGSLPFRRRPSRPTPSLGDRDGGVGGRNTSENKVVT